MMRAEPHTVIARSAKPDVAIHLAAAATVPRMDRHASLAMTMGKNK